MTGKLGDIRPRVLAILPGFIPSTLLCVVKPFLQLHQDGYIFAKITLERFVSKENLRWADLVVFCRNTEPRYSHLIHFLLTQKTPFVYELDDNFFELPLDSELGRYHRSPERLVMIDDYMKYAGLVRVYSKPLLEKAKNMNPRTELVVGPIDLSLINPPPNISPKKIRLIYGTSRIQDELSVVFMPALTRILKKYADRVEVHFWGSQPADLKGLPGVVSHKVIRNYDRFLTRFSQAGFDIGLAPLPDDLFHRSKTNNKFREYGACRIAGIYSNIDVYSDCVINEETGLLVPNEPESWYQAMVRMIEDHPLREKIRSQAQKTVWETYSQEKFEQVWWNHIQELLLNRARKGVALAYSPIGETRQTTTISFWRALARIKHLWDNGISGNWKMLKWRLFDIWMMIKLRFRLRISAGSTISKR